jgi:hypothetical protein
MLGSRLVAGAFAAMGATLCLAGAAAAVTSGGKAYEAGTRAHSPYLFFKVSQGKVTKVRWSIAERCNGANRQVESLTTPLNARIRHGHFSKRVHYRIGSSPLGYDWATTKVSGTISGTTAVVKLSDTEDLVSYGTCTGSHTFTASRTARFH